MLEKNNKINLFNEMFGKGRRENTHYVVPQNSTTDFRQKGGLCETQPVETLKKTLLKTCLKCPQCANIAQHLIHLENLIRTKYKNEYNCNLCNSTLNYLQNVNRSIADVLIHNASGKPSRILSNVSKSKVLRKNRRAIEVNTATAIRRSLSHSPVPKKRLRTIKLKSVMKSKPERNNSSWENVGQKTKHSKTIKNKFASGNVRVLPSFVRPPSPSSMATQKKDVTKKSVKKLKKRTAEMK